MKRRRKIKQKFRAEMPFAEAGYRILQEKRKPRKRRKRNALVSRAYRVSPTSSKTKVSAVILYSLQKAH